MVSGKYSALSGAIAREQAIANIANNLANINTSGYKKSRVSFESLLRGEQQAQTAKGINYSRIATNYADFSGGALRQTDNPLDFAIHGDGFFKIQAPEGIRYTRQGGFVINGEGLLTTSNGLPVLSDGNDQITIPDTDTNKIAIAEDGTIYTLGLGDERQEVGRLAVVDIEDTTQLRREADTAFSLNNPALEIPTENSRIIQGSVELSNVNMAEEMATMIDSYRTFETYHKVLESYSTLGEQQEELGTLG